MIFKLRNFLNLRFFIVFLTFSILITSYFFKSFQLLSIAFTFFLLFGFFLKNIKKNIVLTLFSISFVLTLIEISLFLTNNQIDLNLKKDNTYNKDVKYEKTYLGYQPKPGKHNHLIVSNGKILLDSIYTIGQDGFRITPKSDAINYSKKINFFGGSYTFGWGVNDDETLPYYFQNYNQSWKVKNYAINGYGAHQMLAQIENDPKILEDINILITSNFHIPRSSCKRDYSFGTPKYIIDDKNNLKRDGYCANLLLKSIQLPKIFGSIINRSEIKKLFDNIFLKPKEINSRDIEIYISIIKKTNKLIKENEKKFFVGYIKNNLNDIDQVIFQKLKKENINYIDLSLKPKKNYELYDGHPNKKANIKRSKIISDHIKTFLTE